MQPDRFGHFANLLMLQENTPSTALLNSAPVLCCRKKCKPGTSPGLVQQQYSKLINKNRQLFGSSFDVCAYSLGNPPCLTMQERDCFPETDLPRHLPAEATQLALGMICKVPDIIYCLGHSYFKKRGQTVLNEPPI